MRRLMLVGVLMSSLPLTARADRVYWAECHARGGSHAKAEWKSYEYATSAEAQRKAAEHDRQNPGHTATVHVADACNAGLTRSCPDSCGEKGRRILPVG